MSNLQKTQEGGFTLLEVLIATAILSLLFVLFANIVNVSSKTWQSSREKVESFKAARDAFENMTSQLSQATLNTYWDYNDPNQPTQYQRQSELHFASGPASTLLNTDHPAHAVFFQAPVGFTADDTLVGLRHTLNEWGFFIAFGNDLNLRPPFITSDLVPPSYRFRLMEFMQPTEQLSVYSMTSTANLSTALDWFRLPIAANEPSVRVLAENVIALVIVPHVLNGSGVGNTGLQPVDYTYDSRLAPINDRHQMPPVLEVTMVAIDEASALRLAAVNGTNMPDLDLETLFQKMNSYEDFQTDLQELEKSLTRENINYRVFSTKVGIRSAKWSAQ